MASKIQSKELVLEGIARALNTRTSKENKRAPDSPYCKVYLFDKPTSTTVNNLRKVYDIVYSQRATRFNDLNAQWVGMNGINETEGKGRHVDLTSLLTDIEGWQSTKDTTSRKVAVEKALENMSRSNSTQRDKVLDVIAEFHSRGVANPTEEMIALALKYYQE